MADSRPERQENNHLLGGRAEPTSTATTTNLIFNSTYEFIGLLRPDGTLLDANQSALEFVGATLAEVKEQSFVNTPWWARDAESRAKLQAGIIAAAQGEFVRFEAKHHNPRGDEIIVDFSLKPIRDERGAVALLLPEGRDITERKQTEAALQRAYDELEQKVQERTTALTAANAALQAEIAARTLAEEKVRTSEERLRGILGSIDEVVWSTSPNGEEVYFISPAAEQLYGRPTSDFYTLPHLWLDVIHPDDRACVAHAFQVQAETGRFDEEYRIIRPDGEIRWVHDRGHYVYDEQGTPLRTDGVATDITEKNQLEQQYLRAQRMEGIGTLAGGIAHDLNNILAPITMGVQMLQRRHADEFSRKMLEMMQTNLERGATMIQQILSFARGGASQQVAVQPKHLIKELIKLMRETFPKEITIHQQVSNDLWLVEGDPTRLHQVLMNLCVNARDAMPAGGKLTLSAENQSLDELSARMLAEVKAGNFVVITVSDTGTGIAHEHLDRIFDPFFTTKEQGKGTGLGLATVYGIIKAHGGFLNVYSEVGQGTQFKIYLPAQTITPHHSPKPTELSPPLAGSGELILIVDDEASICEITRAALETFGYRVLTANDGVEAISLYAQHQAEVRLVVTDMMMPLMDGPTMIRTLRKLNPQVIVIGSSGLPEEGKAQEARALGVQHILAKPYNAETLLHIIASLLQE